MFQLKQFIENLISFIPYVGKWRAVFLKHSIPGHFYSPIPDLDFIESRREVIFEKDKVLHGVDMNDEIQLNYLDQMSIYLNDFPFPEEKSQDFLFYNNNIYYHDSDAASLYAMLRVIKPTKIIEVGSGFSSSLIIDTINKYMNLDAELSLIEPNPERLINVVGKEILKYNLIEKFVQEVDLSIFKSLNKDDILFIDSSHVSKIDSDLNFIIFEILPVLKAGVIVHFHDIFYPFEYPELWIKKGYFWNENYFLKAFLMYNVNFEIIFMNTFLCHKYFDRIPESIKLIQNKDRLSGSLWLRKVI